MYVGQNIWFGIHTEVIKWLRHVALVVISWVRMERRVKSGIAQIRTQISS
jgi:hypothetical protein